MPPRALQSDLLLVCVVVLIAEPVECVTTHPNSSPTPLKSKRAVISNTQSKRSLFLCDIEKEKRLFYFDRTGRLRRDIKATGSSTKTRGGELGLQPRLSDTPLFSRYLWLRSCFCDISARDARGVTCTWFVSPTAPNISGANWSQPCLQLFSIYKFLI